MREETAVDIANPYATVKRVAQDGIPEYIALKYLKDSISHWTGRVWIQELAIKWLVSDRLQVLKK